MDQQPILLTVDTCLFCYRDGALYILLVRRDASPFHGIWALPGGWVDPDTDNTLQSCALRKLKAKTGRVPRYIEQLVSLGGPSRDPRQWSVSVSFLALTAPDNDAEGSKIQGQWIPVTEAISGALAFDHRDIILQAIDRLRQKVLYSMVVGYALAEAFTLPELQALCEHLLGCSVQAKSFRRRVDASNVLEETGQFRKTAKRPAKLYRLKPEAKTFTFVRNLLNG